MNKSEYMLLENEDNLISVEDLVNKSDRTLIYGYTCARNTFHVYLKEGKIHAIVYSDEQNIREIDVVVNRQYLPDKRIYPEACDYEFCRLLKAAGCSLLFAPWNDSRDKAIFYGYVLPM